MIYHFYMQQTDKAGTVVSNSKKDLETDFSGLVYKACKGLSSVGKPKNVYTENYAEASGLRTFLPGDNGGSVAHEATDIELELLFKDSSRRATYDSFCAYIKTHRLFYWDTARHKKVWLVLTDAIEPTEDVLKGVPYILATFKFKNLWGIGKTCADDGTLSS